MTDKTSNIHKIFNKESFAIYLFVFSLINNYISLCIIWYFDFDIHCTKIQSK